MYTIRQVILIYCNNTTENLRQGKKRTAPQTPRHSQMHFPNSVKGNIAEVEIESIRELTEIPRSLQVPENYKKTMNYNSNCN